ncbi:hypothetical protein SK128_018981 [Halocaridina rubra]|uniref:Uncharacterized protein n=1 Tax=Halocaridina rubra TaxID=373956 RepID=A0AAN8X260_HALRR
MIDSLITFGAVPFGYTSELWDSNCDLTSNDQCFDMSFHTNCRNPQGIPPLPDVILSNTPPPSPLRRAHSYHFLFPEKTEGTQGRVTTSALQRSFSFLPTPPPTPLSPQGEAHRGSICSTAGDNDREVNNVRTGLSHIQEVRRKLPDPPAHFQPHEPLPQLTWEVPAIQRSRRVEYSSANQPTRNRESPDGSSKKAEKSGMVKEEGDRLRQIGNDLRRIADQFQLDNGKVSKKRQKKDDAGAAWDVPVVFTRCISGALLCLVWWRLLNKLQ